MVALLIGIEGGGTKTRVLCTDTSGKVLGYAVGKGCKPKGLDASRQSVRAALVAALNAAGASPNEVVSLCAGLAGVDTTSDEEWAHSCVDLPGLSATRQFVNDTVLAHRANFGASAGVVAVAGTGAIVTAFDPSRGLTVRNYDYDNYARATSRHLSYAALFGLLTRADKATDPILENGVLAHFGVESIEKLREVASGLIRLPEADRYRLLSDLGPVVTSAAAQGSRIAKRVCRGAVAELTEAIRLVASHLRYDTIEVVGIGSVANDPYVRAQIVRALARQHPPRLRLLSAGTPPVVGALLMAASSAPIAVTLERAVIEEIRNSVIKRDKGEQPHGNE